MKLSNNINILPFYSSREHMNHMKSYAYSNIYPLFAVDSKVPPFQIPVSPIVTLDEPASIQIKFIDFNTGQEYNATGWTLGLKLVNKGNYSLLINDGKSKIVDPNIVSHPTSLVGHYYLQIFVHYIDANDEYHEYYLYSDIITFVDSANGLLKLEYWDNQDFVHTYGVIHYGDEYVNFVYLQTQTGKPEYIFEDEINKRDGYNFFEKQISEKKYKFEFTAPEFLCDALRIVRMHDNVRITNIDGSTFNVDTFMITPKWQDSGDIAIVEVEFECDTVIKKIAKQFTPSANNSFNEDFNSDYI